MSVASNPLVFSALFGYEEFSNINTIQTSLNPEPMMKTNTIPNAGGSGVPLNYQQAVFQIADGDVSIYYVIIYAWYSGNLGYTLPIPIPEIPPNENQSVAPILNITSGGFENASVSWNSSTSTLTINVGGSGNAPPSTTLIGLLITSLNPSLPPEPLQL